MALKQVSAANRFVLERRIDPCISAVFPWENIPDAHRHHSRGNMAVLVNAPRAGPRTSEAVAEAAGLE